MRSITNNLYQISLGAVNVFVLKSNNGLILFDTGYQGSEDKIEKALISKGLQLTDIHHIILTHAHPDHVGSLKALQEKTQANIYAHPLAAEAIKNGEAQGLENVIVSPGFHNRMIYNLAIKNSPPTYPAATVNDTINDGDTLPLSNGMTIIHTPGHSAGHIAILIPSENTLIGGDICSNLPWLGYSTVNDDIKLAHQSILKAATHHFEILCLGHGKAIKRGANQKLLRKFS